MKLAIVGSRSFTDYGYLKKSLLEFICEFPNNYYGKSINITEVVSGGAEGADKLAERWAIDLDIALKIFYPDWNKYGKAAGPIRNKQIIDYCDILIAFWDKKSKGTWNSIDLALKQNKLGQIFYI